MIKEAVYFIAALQQKGKWSSAFTILEKNDLTVYNSIFNQVIKCGRKIKSFVNVVSQKLPSIHRLFLEKLLHEN